MFEGEVLAGAAESGLNFVEYQLRDPQCFRLLLVDCLFQFGPWGKLRNPSGSDLDSGAGLRIAPVARLSLRHGERAKSY